MATPLVVDRLDLVAMVAADLAAVQVCVVPMCPRVAQTQEIPQAAVVAGIVHRVLLAVDTAAEATEAAAAEAAPAVVAQEAATNRSGQCLDENSSARY